MKKVSFVVLLLLAASFTFAQSEKYTNKMKELVAQLDSSRTTEAFNTLMTSFERIADAEKTQMLPYYYASLCQLNAANFQVQGMGDNSAITDPAADKAEELLKKALALGKENSETWILKKMIASLRMMGNPMQRFMEYGPIAAKALETAKKLDPNNPRIYILEGQDKYYTPEQFGGSKTEAKKLFTKAVELFKTFKPETELHPNWGLMTANYFLTLKED
jgi:tetratricopeptide (TPR) repeat protein